MPVDATYVISLPRATERWSRVASRLDLAGISYARFDAVDGRDFQRVGTPPPDVHRACWQTCTPGALGCALSHIALWKVCAAAGHESTLIVEDDVVLCDNFKDRLASVLDHAPRDFDILLLGYLDPSTSQTYAFSPQEDRLGTPGTAGKDTAETPDIVDMPRFYGTHAYVISKQGALKLRKARATFQVDIQLSLTPDLNIYAVKDVLATQEVGDTPQSFVAPVEFPAACNLTLQKLEVPVMNLYGRSKVPPWMACILIALAALYVPREWLALFFTVELIFGGFSGWWALALNLAALFSFAKA